VYIYAISYPISFPQAFFHSVNSFHHHFSFPRSQKKKKRAVQMKNTQWGTCWSINLKQDSKNRRPNRVFLVVPTGPEHRKMRLTKCVCIFLCTRVIHSCIMKYVVRVWLWGASSECSSRSSSSRAKCENMIVRFFLGYPKENLCGPRLFIVVFRGGSSFFQSSSNVWFVSPCP
jgi:hypothetical protein